MAMTPSTTLNSRESGVQHKRGGKNLGAPETTPRPVFSASAAPLRPYLYPANGWLSDSKNAYKGACEPHHRSSTQICAQRPVDRRRRTLKWMSSTTATRKGFSSHRSCPGHSPITNPTKRYASEMKHGQALQCSAERKACERYDTALYIIRCIGRRYSVWRIKRTSMPPVLGMLERIKKDAAVGRSWATGTSSTRLAPSLSSLFSLNCA